MFKPPFQEINKAAPDSRARLIMQQIGYWAPKARVKRDGFAWVVKSRQDLADETHLSIRQVDRALRTIKNAGTLVIERHLFAGDVALWIRFPAKESWKSLLPKLAKYPSPKSAKPVLPKSAKTITKEYKQRTTDKGLQNYEQGISEQEQGEDLMKYGGKVSEKILEMKAKQQEASSAEQVQESVNQVISNPTQGNLVKLWSCAWVHAGFGFCQKPSVKDSATLKNLVKDFGPEVSAALIVESMLHWKKFSVRLSEEAGFSGKAPVTPTIWFLWTHRALGLAWLEKLDASPQGGSSGASATLSDDDLWGKLD